MKNRQLKVACGCLVACLVTACGPGTTRNDKPPSGAAGTTGAAGIAPTGDAGAGEMTTGAAGDGPAGAGAGGTTSGAGGEPGSDAGASDATADVRAHEAGSDATASEGGPASGCAGLLCETFDGVAPGKTGSPWLVDLDTKGTVLETVADKGHTDTHSLHIKISALAGVHGYLTETQTLAATGASFWGRVFIWYAVDTPNVHIVNVAVDGKMANGMSEQVRIVNVIGTHIATNRRSDDMGKGSSVVPPNAKWGCYEWHLTPNTLDVYLDGAMLPISETWAEPTLSLLRVGFERFSAGAAGDVWLDDIGVGAARLGCN